MAGGDLELELRRRLVHLVGQVLDQLAQVADGHRRRVEALAAARLAGLQDLADRLTQTRARRTGADERKDAAQAERATLAETFASAQSDLAAAAAALDIAEAKGLARYNSEQPLYNLYDRAGFEGGLQKVCIENEVGVIPYYGLASGFLTGKYRTEADLSKSPRGQGVKRMMDARGMRILDALDEVSA